MTDRLLSPDDLAVHFGVDRLTIIAWSKRFAWPRTQIGVKTIRWTTAQLAEIEAKHSVTPTGVTPRDGRTARSARRAS